MIIPIIKQARFFYYSGLVYLMHADEKTSWFSVLDHNVRFEYGEGYLKMSCDCKFEGVKGIAKNSICSHILACLFYAYGKQGKLKCK